MKRLALSDATVATIIEKEHLRQEQEINLIASENYASPAVLEATGSVLTNKYAEGYPGKRYYAGCRYVDEVEQLAIDRCKQLFGVEHANVQPHAGSQANMAVYFSVLKPGDTIMGMSLNAGGHLTHGHAVNFSGMLYNVIPYGVSRETELLDYAQIERMAHEHKPKLMIIGASAYSHEFDFKRFASIAQSVGAYCMADIAHIAGLVAAGVHSSPVEHVDFVSSTTHKTLRGPRGGLVMCKAPHAQAVDRAIMPGLQGGPFMHVIAAKAVAFGQALKPDFIEYQKQVVRNAQAMAKTFAQLDYRIVGGSTQNHLFVLDLRSKNINGKQAQDALEASGIIVSRSTIPFDTEKPYIGSGIRLGTPAITTRGMKEPQAQQIAHIIDEVLSNATNESLLTAIREQVTRFCKDFPIYQDHELI